jgi:hypothetical protein
MNIVAMPQRLDTYHLRLRSSIKDKLWFVSRVPEDVTVFADFGCADGALLANLKAERQCDVIGYDRNKSSIEAAIARSPQGGFWTPHLALFAAELDALHKQGKKSCLILSSVVHEVLSEGTSFHSFWKTIRALGCDYIAIRDMGVEHDLYDTPVEPSLEQALMRSDKLTHWLLYGCEEVGRVGNKREMLEGLLKYDYEDTTKEYAETYLSLSAEQWINLTTVGSGYQLRHFDHYPLAYHVRRWEEDFGVSIKEPTHVNLLLKKV